MNRRHATIVLLALSVVAMSALMGMAVAAKNPNPFNRLFVPPKDRDTSIKNDGIHDSGAPGLSMLQEPKTAFSSLPTSPAGNYINWVQALNKGAIQPHFNHLDPTEEAMPMDLVIIREVKGSMPNVRFPHQQHTVWLECANCHDAIFKPQKGANSMSMAEIMLGQKCGVCHGSVAFPVTECRRCHSESKAKKTVKKKTVKK